MTARAWANPHLLHSFTARRTLSPIFPTKALFHFTPSQRQSFHRNLISTVRMGKKPVHLEGTTLEGGGQLLRIALGLSSLSKKPVRISNIRGKRSGGGGLKAQHLTSVQWLSKACNARVQGIGLKSKEITFTPDRSCQDIQHDQLETSNSTRHFTINQNTPGSINLVFQAILPYILFSGSESPIRIKVIGGTNVSNSPSFDYVDQVLLPMLTSIGLPPISTELHRRGWSTGSTTLGSTTFDITPLVGGSILPTFQLTQRGDIQHLQATIIAPKACESHFRDELDIMFSKRSSAIFGCEDPKSEIYDITFEDSGHEKRFYLLLVATTTNGYKLGRDWLYDHGFRAGKIDTIISKMVKKVTADLVEEIQNGGCVDEWMRDQLVVFQALAQGKSVVDGGGVEPSLHAQTACWVAEMLLGVEFDEDGGCEGVGFVAGKGVKRDGGDEEVERELVKGLEWLEVS
ncbi:RNA 3'-terminal phosphate cyclase-domain-containing protein [Clohesyomyces aquaticus]|uniref:RNA 3'-terminal phosphate cyclase-domain-containing protein n=1 Tax=Clohesyomyces aquaticus TaxID=1231657 RepID=A0A1Y1YAM0_9PLEO|nr:RNA 3'-terminal phosphate cyclase-domain-containing protein [Clohesyomyces aquaticus]